MKKILSASLVLSTPAMAVDLETAVEKPFASLASIMWEGSFETVNNGAYETRSTNDITASSKVTDIFGGSLSVALTNRSETRTKKLALVSWLVMKNLIFYLLTSQESNLLGVFGV